MPGRCGPSRTRHRTSPRTSGSPRRPWPTPRPAHPARHPPPAPAPQSPPHPATRPSQAHPASPPRVPFHPEDLPPPRDTARAPSPAASAPGPPPLPADPSRLPPALSLPPRVKARLRASRARSPAASALRVPLPPEPRRTARLGEVSPALRPVGRTPLPADPYRLSARLRVKVHCLIGRALPRAVSAFPAMVWVPSPVVLYRLARLGAVFPVSPLVGRVPLPVGLSRLFSRLRVRVHRLSARTQPRAVSAFPVTARVLPPVVLYRLARLGAVFPVSPLVGRMPLQVDLSHPFPLPRVKAHRLRGRAPPPAVSVFPAVVRVPLLVVLCRRVRLGMPSPILLLTGRTQLLAGLSLSLSLPPLVRVYRPSG
ncbi:hypothetical protein CLV40_12033 [Actinokineospora auranticolor]|uniref:Uncharacterized protein n=1 Tax=Actinokineospora auranticolor TaxID=155976 RepID=A0A2S6GGH5_9PSEU|nr:hypothetical protein CLV40_12033 [Actinokineospora auranticolor]